MPESIAERVTAGAKLLDARRPGWAYLINLADFNIKCCAECALGQLYGSFDEGWHALFDVLGNDPGVCGFDILDDGTLGEYSELQRFWMAEILSRRHSPAKLPSTAIKALLAPFVAKRSLEADLTSKATGQPQPATV